MYNLFLFLIKEYQRLKNLQDSIKEKITQLGLLCDGKHFSHLFTKPDGTKIEGKSYLYSHYLQIVNGLRTKEKKFDVSFFTPLNHPVEENEEDWIVKYKTVYVLRRFGYRDDDESDRDYEVTLANQKPFEATNSLEISFPTISRILGLLPPTSSSQKIEMKPATQQQIKTPNLFVDLIFDMFVICHGKYLFMGDFTKDDNLIEEIQKIEHKVILGEPPKIEIFFEANNQKFDRIFVKDLSEKYMDSLSKAIKIANSNTIIISILPSIGLNHDHGTMQTIQKIYIPPYLFNKGTESKKTPFEDTNYYAKPIEIRKIVHKQAIESNDNIEPNRNIVIRCEDNTDRKHPLEIRNCPIELPFILEKNFFVIPEKIIKDIREQEAGNIVRYYRTNEYDIQEPTDLSEIEITDNQGNIIDRVQYLGFSAILEIQKKNQKLLQKIQECRKNKERSLASCYKETFLSNQKLLQEQVKRLYQHPIIEHQSNLEYRRKKK